MNKLCAFLPKLAILAASTVPLSDAWAQSSQVVNGYRWYYVVKDGVARLDSAVDSKNICISCVQPNSANVTLTVPETLGGYRVTGMTPCAFNTCKAAKIILPKYMTSLATDAFLWLPNLTEIDMSQTLITKLEYHNFDFQNYRKTIIRTPKTLREIGYDALVGWKYDFQFYVPSLDDWCPVRFELSGKKDAYSGNRKVVVYYNGSAVSDLSAVKTAVTIGDGAFSYQPSLLSGVIPPSVTNVGWYAFQGCESMTNVVFTTPADVGEHAFDGCSKIGSAEFPDGMGSLSHFAFTRCTSLTNVIFHGTCASLKSYVFYGCEKLKTIRFPDGITILAVNLFSGCKALESVAVPESVTVIGTGAFSRCDSLGRIDLPENLEELGYESMAFCTNLASVTIPAKVATVGGLVFEKDIRLREVRWLGPCPTLTEDEDIYSGTDITLVSRVSADESWIPALRRGLWCDRRIMTEGGPWQVTFELTDRGSRTGGGALDQTVPSEGAATPPTVASTDEDYEFVGWDRPVDYFGYDATVTAVFQPKAIQRKSSETVAVTRFATNEVELLALGGVRPYVWTLASETPLPEGCVLTTNGFLIAAKSTSFLGDCAFSALVTDSAGSTNVLSFTLSVGENPDGKPQVASRSPAESSPLASEAAARTFSVAASDPEGGTLNYRWLLDGEEVQSGPSPSFAYAAPEDGAAAHTLVCQIEDDVWKGSWTTATEWTVRTLFAPLTDPPSGTIFTNGTGQVSITSAVAGVTIYVASGGSAPHPVEAFRYTGPLTLTKSETLVFQAVSDGVSSAYGTAHFVCATPVFASAVGVDASVTFETDGAADWTVVEDATAPDGTTSLRSGAIGCEETSSLTASFSGSGTFSFQWKVDCEEDPSGDCSWDALLVYVDDETEPRETIDGTTDWLSVTLDFDTEGDHTVTWVFAKDDYDDEPIPYADCGWIDKVRWTSGEPFPELASGASAADIAAVFGEAGDRTRLVAHLTTRAKYAAFRTWAKKLEASGGADGKTVKAHARAWPSFALGLDRLIDRELADDDFVVRTFAPSGTAGRFSLTASVGEWTVGSGATAENLATLVGVSGSSELDPEKFSSKNVSVTFGEPVDGNLSLTVGPADTTASSFFMRLIAQ